MRIGFFTAPHLPDFPPDDQLVLPYLQTLGIEVVPLIWTEPVPKSGFDALIMRSCWDYHFDISGFKSFLGQLKDNPLPVWNAPELMLYNLDKHYLLDLQAAGHAVIPSQIMEATEAFTPEQLFAQNWQEVVVKPLVSGTGYQTYRLKPNDPVPVGLAEAQAASGLLVQPFVPSILSEGEWSLIFFEGEFSHAVNKQPAQGNFLIHEEHGGQTLSKAPPLALWQQAQAFADQQLQACLYGRLDYVLWENQWLLIELEVLEPSLYLAHEPAAPARWARAIAKRLANAAL